VNDSDPANAIFKKSVANAHRIADRAAQAQLKEDMLQLKHIVDEKHKSISNLQTLGADLKQKILDLSAKRTALLAELEKVETTLTHARQEESQLPDVIKVL
jgi:chromosome segregation ATPase